MSYYSRHYALQLLVVVVTIEIRYSIIYWIGSDFYEMFAYSILLCRLLSDLTLNKYFSARCNRQFFDMGVHGWPDGINIISFLRNKRFMLDEIV